jgi:AcrR family transcriptional regulator
MARPADPHTKIELLRAAEAVFVEHGLDLARVEDITARARRSKGSFYLHFASKEDAFRQIVETMLARLADYVEQDPPVLPDKPDAAALERFFEHWLDKDVAVFEFLWQNRAVSRLLFEGGKSASYGYLIDEFAERARDRTREVLAAGAKQGIFRPDLDVELGSLIISGAYDRIARELVRLRERPDLRRWLAELQRALLTGLAAPEARAVLDPPVTNHSGATQSPVLRSR